MKREIGFLMSFLCLLLIVGCSHTESTSNHDAPSKTEKPGKQKDEKSESTHSLVGDEIEKEPGGELFQKYIESKEFADQNEYADAEAAAVNHYIQSIKKVNTKNWDEEKWAQSIVTNFRSEYKKTIQPMRDLEIKYKELKLPDGRLLQDVSEEELESQPKKVNIALLLDASRSMKANVPGGNKMKLAKSSLNSFSKSLPDHTKILLSVFGHKGTGDDKDKKLSCKSVETVYPLRPYNKKDFSHALNKFNASGWTPLASAIKKAQASLQKVSDDQTKNFIYVVSDGIETCGGNPVQAAKDAKASNMDVQINIIGFDVDDEADRQLKEVARAGGESIRL